MADSLQDQLRALGLAKKPSGQKQAGKRRKPARKSAPHGKTGEPSLERAYAMRQRQEQREADAARRRKLAEDRRRREINERIRAIVGAHRQNREDADIARNFLFRGRIRKLYVTPEQQAALAMGELGIVYLTGGYHLLASEPLDAVRAIDPEHVVELDSGSSDEEEFPVPDDIGW